MAPFALAAFLRADSETPGARRDLARAAAADAGRAAATTPREETPRDGG